jgi:hypothetical protein
LSRLSHIWAPNTLLCKRFNVALPLDLPVSVAIESNPIKPILADDSVEQLVNIFLKDSKGKIQFDSSEKNRNIRDDFVPSLPENDLFDEIFGSSIDLKSKVNNYRSKAVDYFGED